MKNLILSTVCLGFISVAFSAPIDNPLMAAQYLMYFNYIKQSDMDNGNVLTENVMKEGIQKFQRFTNLTVTGRIDNATMSKMNQPRCGVPDIMFNVDAARKRRFAAAGNTWRQSTLTWRIDNVTPDFGTQADIERIMEESLQYWADVSGLSFTKVPRNADADIVISFVKYSHGDGNPFDGPGMVLAHAYFPGSGIGGDAHFDDSERFDAAGNGINLRQVAVHEFGHSLGLGHSEVNDAVMAPYYQRYDENFALHPDDIAGIQSLYGSNVGAPDVTMPPVTMPPNVPCSGRFDTITRLPDRGTYAFKGDMVFKLNNNGIGIATGFPAKISDVFPGLPNDLDASVFLNDVGRTYFFKGDQYYRISGTRLRVDNGYPRPISNWNGLPSDLDSAFVWSGNGRVYFIKGDQYYRVSRYSGRVNSGYPRPLSVWRGLPSSIDSAFQWSNSRTYFFSGNQYYRFDDRSFRVARSYPRSTVQYWLGCNQQTFYAATTPASGGAVYIPSMAVIVVTTILSVIYL